MGGERTPDAASLDPPPLPAMDLTAVRTELVKSYMAKTKQHPILRLIDGFALCALVTALLQLVYCTLFGTYPFNAFLAGFISCIGILVFTVCLRIQINPQNRSSNGTTVVVPPRQAIAQWFV